jgi:predicted O-linked N-acetylglucosamine transferase (SPINDLY family)
MLIRPDRIAAMSTVDKSIAQAWQYHRAAHGRVAPLGEPGHSRDPNRRLSIGYLSPDFYNHPAMSFLEPILTHHDPGQVETICYAEVQRPDAVTARIRSLAHGWRSE